MMVLHIFVSFLCGVKLRMLFAVDDNEDVTFFDIFEDLLHVHTAIIIIIIIIVIIVIAGRKTTSFLQLHPDVPVDLGVYIRERYRVPNVEAYQQVADHLAVHLAVASHLDSWIQEIRNHLLNHIGRIS